MRKRGRNKSPSDNTDDHDKQTEQAESERNDDTLALDSSEQLGNTSHHPPNYELVSESASPYAEVMGQEEETTNPGGLYSEVTVVRAAKQSVKKGNTNAQEGDSVDSTTVKIEATGNVYDDVTVTTEAEELPIQTENTSTNYGLAAAVEDTVAPVYSDVSKIKETAATQEIKEQKPPISPFAKNYANTIKSLADKFKPPSNDLKADSVDDLYDDAAIVKMNDTRINEDMQDDDADNVYQEASAVNVERLADSKISNGAKLCQAKPSNIPIPSQGRNMKSETKMQLLDEDMTLVENSLYGERKDK